MNDSEKGLRFGRRRRRPDSGRIPVVIFTGFLGAGKTSLIQQLTKTPAGAGSAIIVNEFGEIGFDQTVLGTSGERTVLLGNGCLCCTVRTDLQETLRALFVERTRGAADFRQVLIETSGLADPGPILQTFVSDRALAQEFHLRALVGVVDALNCGATLTEHPLARKQVALSDRLVLTKGDLVSVDQAAAATRQIKALLAGRPVDILRAGDDWNALVSDSVDFGTRRTSFFADAADHDADITAFPVVLERPVPWDAFVQAIRALVALRGRDILRVKGILAVEDCRGPVLFHAVQHLVHEPVELEAWPDDERQSRLIFITRGVDQAQVTNLISAMVGLTASVP